jgi:hypothetical protein
MLKFSWAESELAFFKGQVHSLRESESNVFGLPPDPQSKSPFQLS